MNTLSMIRLSIPPLPQWLMMGVVGLILVTLWVSIQLLTGEHSSAMTMEQFCQMLKQYSSQSFCPLPYPHQFH